MGVKHKDDYCVAPLWEYAVVQGSLELACVPLFVLTFSSAIAGKALGSTISQLGTTLGVLALGVIGLARFGVLIWVRTYAPCLRACVGGNEKMEKGRNAPTTHTAGNSDHV